ncbi:luciferase-like domain-containing protein [Podospora australis]|uniref:Luciferase-like domain-containing protein n=1 Tax=Podospora australis TaxID=1536484 RepID=A0AAN6WSH6_9PEZI|nr:luciferase-like domain-containing protein [Podospora australis]
MSLEAAAQLNSDPERLLFAYWVPNVSGGLVVSKIPQRTDWTLKSNLQYARTAEKYGFEYALTQIRFTSSYGASNQHESVSFSQAILSGTEKLKVIAAILPGPWNPAVAAKQLASIDNYSDGRIAVNIVSGWFKGEFTAIGEWWLDHAERYRRSNEFMRCLRGIWTAPEDEGFTFAGDFYRFRNYKLSPKPVQKPHPPIFQGGNSEDARVNGAEVADWYFMNGNDLEGFRAQIQDVKARAAKVGREKHVKFAVNGFVIVRDTEEEAVRVLQEIQGKADVEAINAFANEVKNAGQSTKDKQGMWATSTFNDLVQYNDGFKTKLIGTKEQVAERIVLLKALGVDLVLTAFLHYEEEVEQFGRDVLPLVRQLEAQGRGKDVEYEIQQTGDVYRKRTA